MSLATYSHPKAPTVWSFFGFYFRLDGTWVRLLLMLWWYVLTTLQCILVLDIFGNFSGTCESRSLGAFAIIFTLQTGGPTGNVSIRCFKQSKSYAQLWVGLSIGSLSGKRTVWGQWMIKSKGLPWLLALRVQLLPTRDFPRFASESRSSGAVTELLYLKVWGGCDSRRGCNRGVYARSEGNEWDQSW